MFVGCRLKLDVFSHCANHCVKDPQFFMVTLTDLQPCPKAVEGIYVDLKNSSVLYKIVLTYKCGAKLSVRKCCETFSDAAQML